MGHRTDDPAAERLVNNMRNVGTYTQQAERNMRDVLDAERRM
jgi:hypothetical protein